ncbi:MAG: hypothetical protein ACFCUI_11275 [Bernardetiaceae bacterium]
MRSIKDFFNYTAAILLIVFGLVMILGVGVSVQEDGMEKLLGNLVGLVIAGVVPTLGGLRLLQQTHKKRQRQQSEERERHILQLAADSSGKLTASELALKSHLSLNDAQERLQWMQQKGFATLYTSPKGAVVYVFPELLSEHDRNNLDDLFLPL